MAVPYLGLLIVGLPFMLAVSYFVGRWALAPLRKSQPKPLPPTQFQITDGYVLTGQLALVALVMIAVQSGQAGLRSLTVLLPVWLLCAWAWWLGIRWLSWSGVRSASRRAWVLGCATPLAFIVLPLILAGPLAIVRTQEVSKQGGVGTVTRDVFLFYGLEVPAPAGNLSGPILTVLLCLSFGVSFYVVRSLAAWAARGARDRHEPIRAGESPA